MKIDKLIQDELKGLAIWRRVQAEKKAFLEKWQAAEEVIGKKMKKAGLRSLTLGDGAILRMNETGVITIERLPSSEVGKILIRLVEE